MAMEKRGVVKPGTTPDIDHKLDNGEKRASTEAKTEALDDDFTKRAAEKATESLT